MANLMFVMPQHRQSVFSGSPILRLLRIQIIAGKMINASS